jgi:hypothetical protein
MKIVKKNTTYFINIKNNNEQNIIDKYLFSEVELKEINKDVLCIAKIKDKDTVDKPIKETTKEDTTIEDTNKKIIDLLNDKSLDFRNKIEGNFEKLLNKKDLEIFKEMLKNKEVILNKLSEKYKKSFYKPNVVINQKGMNYKETTIKKDNDIDFEDFKKNEYVIFNDDYLAQRFSQIFSEQLRTGEIRGTKSFDGSYYVIFTSVFEKVNQKLLKTFNKDFTVLEASEKLKQPDDLIKCVLEILKEDCVIIEKKKGIYFIV